MFMFLEVYKSVIRVIVYCLFMSGLAPGYDKVAESGFETNGLTGWWNDGDNASILSSGAHSGDNCVKYIPGGHFGMTDISPTFREFYMRFWVKFEGDIPCRGCSSDGKHFWRVCSWPNKNGGIGEQFDTNILNGQHGIFFFGGGVETGHYEADPFVTGQWHRVAVRARLESTPGAGDGHLVMEVDGVRIFDDHDYNIAGSWSGGFDTFMHTNYDGITGHWLLDDYLFLAGAGAYDYQDGSAKVRPIHAHPAAERLLVNCTPDGRISLVLAGPLHPGEVMQVVDIAGNMLWAERAEPGMRLYRWNASGAPAGAYSAVWIGPGTVITRTFVLVW
jgi:hypothetical protein